MTKRKATYDAAAKVNTTPTESIAQNDYSAEFAQGEHPMKGANRNSKKGREGKKICGAKEDT
ncbi:Stage 0 sporulation regulatory protein [Pontibacillus halophilus JSM 076056 = DSM 19796]|uniref:Stage 0 sporulation regulatory protein n=1 Tax=Pontibacillus halophilus JSM 076056 = DSM 19796 TaxID=1385510 RepID=A0A0A5I9F4_9BACI|nr:hypothetical protein [Pontibacillus halophilus]KGX92462.1 Stage 0 sporulation regulatory protein [Pontibacillus halophilus JSM 076056 = DSM 19796]